MDLRGIVLDVTFSDVDNLHIIEEWIVLLINEKLWYMKLMHALETDGLTEASGTEILSIYEELTIELLGVTVYDMQLSAFLKNHFRG